MHVTLKAGVITVHYIGYIILHKTYYVTYATQYQLIMIRVKIKPNTLSEKLHNLIRYITER